MLEIFKHNFSMATICLSKKTRRKIFHLEILRCLSANLLYETHIIWLGTKFLVWTICTIGIAQKTTLKSERHMMFGINLV